MENSVDILIDSKGGGEGVVRGSQLFVSWTCRGLRGLGFMQCFL